MAKGNCLYQVCVYEGSMSSYDKKVVYTTSKESEAERFHHSYLKEHPNVCKSYIERSYGRDTRRRVKHMREDDE